MLGDSAENPRYIETLPKRSYGFIADVAIVDFDGRNGGLVSAPTESPPRTTVSNGVNPAAPSPLHPVALLTSARERGAVDGGDTCRGRGSGARKFGRLADSLVVPPSHRDPISGRVGVDGYAAQTADTPPPGLGLATTTSLLGINAIRLQRFPGRYIQ